MSEREVSPAGVHGGGQRIGLHLSDVVHTEDEHTSSRNHANSSDVPNQSSPALDFSDIVNEDGGSGGKDHPTANDNQRTQHEPSLVELLERELNSLLNQAATTNAPTSSHSSHNVDPSINLSGLAAVLERFCCESIPNPGSKFYQVSC